MSNDPYDFAAQRAGDQEAALDRTRGEFATLLDDACDAAADATESVVNIEVDKLNVLDDQVHFDLMVLCESHDPALLAKALRAAADKIDGRYSDAFQALTDAAELEHGSACGCDLCEAVHVAKRVLDGKAVA